MSLLQEIKKSVIKKRPELKAGQIVRVHQRIKEGEKQRIQVFEGLVIKINSGYGPDKTFTVRKIVESIGVEKTFPLYSPIIEKIEIKKKSKIRRAKIYYMRDRRGKSARLKGQFVQEEAPVEEEVEKSIEELAEKKAKEEKEKAQKESAEGEVIGEGEVEEKVVDKEKPEEIEINEENPENPENPESSEDSQEPEKNNSEKAQTEEKEQK